jgi:hypothetical protein
VQADTTRWRREELGTEVPKKRPCAISGANGDLGRKSRQLERYAGTGEMGPHPILDEGSLKRCGLDESVKIVIT